MAHLSVDVAKVMKTQRLSILLVEGATTEIHLAFTAHQVVGVPCFTKSLQNHPLDRLAVGEKINKDQKNPQRIKPKFITLDAVASLF